MTATFLVLIENSNPSISEFFFIFSVRHELQNITAQIRVMEEKIKGLNSELTTAEAQMKKEQLKKETKEMEAKLELLTGQGKYEKNI